MFKNGTLYSKLRLRITLLVLCALILMSTIMYSMVVTEKKNRLNAQIDHVNQQIDLFFNFLISDVESSIEAIQENINNGVSIEKVLQMMQTGTLNSSTFFIGTSDGMFYHYPKYFVADDFDPRKRVWYELALANPNQIQWSDPYIDHGTENWTITASKKIQLKDQHGVLGIDIHLNQLTETIIALSSQNEMPIYLVSSNHYVITDTRGQHNGKLFETSFLDIEHYAYQTFENDKQVGYTLYIFSSNQELTSLIKQTILIILFVLITLIIVADRVSMLLAKTFLAPLSSLLESIKLAKRGIYNAKCAEEGEGELKALAIEFNEMIENINQSNEEIHALYEEIYASEETLQEQYDALFEQKKYIEESERRYKQIFQASRSGLWHIDREKKMKFLNPKWYEDFDLDLNESSMRHWLNLIHPHDREQVNQIVDEHLKNKTDSYQCEYRVIDRNNQYKWIQGNGKARFTENGEFLSMSGSHLDITNRKNTEIKIREIAFRDSLTGLNNRVYFEEKLKQSIDSEEQGFIAFMDIDHFKYINDFYGHSVGDEVLKTVAKRLKTFFHEEDVVSRFGGDEYIILIKNPLNCEMITTKIHSLIKEVEKAIQHDGKIISLKVSIGLTPYDLNTDSVDSILQSAEIAMYQAKKISKSSFYFFDDEIKALAMLEMQMENHLKFALEKKEFEIYYQPILHRKTQEVAYYEALIRWVSPKMGLISPGTFIPLAEKAGLIGEIGEFVIEQSIEFLKKYQKQKGERTEIAVNVSAIQLMEEQFVHRIIDLIKANEIHPSQLKLEITESMSLESNEMVISKLYYLKNYGIGIALDDFGTGYSSFQSLMSLPFTVIKIDRSVIRNALTSANAKKLLQSIVDFAHKSNIEVVAEGIEEKHYIELSENLKVDYLQGYYFSRPLPENKIIDPDTDE